MEVKDSTRLKARLGDKLIRNADKYFSGDLMPIAVEMLQNARRAGAGRVDVTVTDTGTITFADDGRGLAREDAGVLLTFGGSANSDDVEFREDPAGMGFFCLAGRRVEVASRDWEMVIPPKAMTGEEDAILRSSATPTSGLTVTAGGFGPIAESTAKIASAASHMPLEIRINGALVEHVPFSAYLEGDGARSLRRSAHGCEIIVTRWPAERAAPMHRASGLYAQTSSDLVVDMFGQVFQISDTSAAMADYLPFLAKGGLERGVPQVHESGGDWTFRDAKPFWRIAIKIGETSVLAPRLPARDGIVINDGWRKVAAEVEAMAAELASGLDSNGIPAGAPIRDAAKKLGRTISPCRVAVTSVSYSTNYGEFGEPVMQPAALELRDGDLVAWRRPDAPPATDCMIWQNASVGADVAMAFAMRENRDLALRLVSPFGTEDEHRAAGYATCDQLSFKISVPDGQGKTVKVDASQDLDGFGGMQEALNGALTALAPGASGAVASSLTLTARSSEDPSRTLKLPMSILAWIPDEEYWEAAGFLAVKDVAVHAVVEMLMHAYSWYTSGDSDCDSYDTQQNDAEENFHDFVSPVLIGKDEACVNAIAEALKNVMRSYSAEGGSLVKQVSIKPLPRAEGTSFIQHRLTITTVNGKRHVRTIN